MSSARGLHPDGALREPAGKRDYNRRLFTVVAPRYDRITRLLSFGRDAAWKRELVRRLPPGGAARCLDVACGTGDLALLLRERYPGAAVTGLDLTESMLALARRRAEGRNIEYLEGDMGRLPVGDGSVDILTGGYALRNAPDLPAFLREVVRALRPGGTAAFLDFSRPASPARAALHLAALRAWGGAWGLLFHGNPHVYGYLADSLRLFPSRTDLREVFREAGLEIREGATRFLGMVELLVARKRGAG